MPCLTCGFPTKGKPYCAPHEALARKKGQQGRNRAQTTSQRGYDMAWRKVRALVLANDDQCHWCGEHADTVDHVVPISVDPTMRLDMSNLVPACRACNSGRKPHLM